jgi:hypothetical protein
MTGLGLNERKTVVDSESAVAHLVFKVANLKSSCQFYSNLGLPPFFVEERSQLLHYVEALITIRVLWPSISSGVITRVKAAFTIKTKADSEQHRIPQQFLHQMWFPLSAFSTISSTWSEPGISATATKEQRPFTGIGRSSSIR